MSSSRLRPAYNALITAALAPGILCHEYAHVFGCRLWSIEVHTMPTLNPFGDDAYVDHEPVDSFGPEATIAIAPLVANTALGIVAFASGTLIGNAVVTILCYWIGTTLAVTAFPSPSDTTGLLETAKALPAWQRPAGYLIAAPVRGFSVVPGAAGFVGFFWIFVLYGLAASLAGGA